MSVNHRKDSFKIVAKLEYEALEDERVEGVMNLHKQESRENIRKSIIQTRESFNEENRSNSLQTIFALTNSMVGSVCLVVPITFINSGILSSVVYMIILALIQFKTCQLCVIHQRNHEHDFETMIKRILNDAWAKVFGVASSILLFIVGIIYYLLICNSLFLIFEFFFQKANFTNFENKSTGNIVFSKFSIQWLAIIIMVPICPLLLIKSMKGIVKLAHAGIIAIVAYIIFVFYIFIKNVSDKSVSFSGITLWNWDPSGPLGNFSLAFMVHNAVSQIIKTNIVKENNSRDLGISFSFATFIYGSIGVFGAFGIYGLSADNPATILDYFKVDDYPTLIINLLFLVHLIATYPLFNFISRHQFSTVFFPDRPIPQIFFFGYSIIYACICILVQICMLKPDLVIAFDGSVCGFLIVYVFPIALHWSALYGNKSEDLEEGLVEGSQRQQEMVEEKKRTFSKLLRGLFYIFLMCIGLANMIYSLYGIIKSLE